MTHPATPAGWATVRLDEIAEVRLGRQRSPKNHTGKQMRPYLRAANVTWDGIDTADVKDMNFTDNEVETYRLRDGDLLLSEASGSAKEVGKPAVWRGQLEGDICFQNTLIRVRPERGIDSDFLYYRFLHEALRGGFVESSRGVGIHHLGSAKLSALTLSLPSTTEQARIAAELADQLARVRRAEDSLTEMRRMFEALDVAVLERSARGCLTGDGQAGGPGQLLAAKPSTKFDYNSLPSLPAGWNWARADEVCEAVFNGNTPKSDEMTAGRGDVPFFKVYNIDKRDGLDFSVRPTYVDRATHDGPLRRSQLRPGDVLINIVGPPMGKVAVVPDQFAEANMNQAIVAFRPGPELDPHFLALALRSPFVLSRLTATSKATAGQFNISLTACRELPVPVPPRAAQAAIVAVAGEYFRTRLPALADLRGLAVRLVAFRKTLLREALAGRLTPPTVENEPVELLLKQIAATRDARGAARNLRKTRTPRVPKTKETSA